MKSVCKELNNHKARIEANSNISVYIHYHNVYSFIILDFTSFLYQHRLVDVEVLIDNTACKQSKLLLVVRWWVEQYSWSTGGTHQLLSFLHQLYSVLLWVTTLSWTVESDTILGT